MRDQAGSRGPRKHSKDTVERLLQDRSELLALYNRVGGLPPFPATSPEEQRQLLFQLCQRLEAYVAATDTLIYERVLTGRERREGVRRLAIEGYPALTRSSELILDFSRRFGSGGLSEAALEPALQELGRQLMIRTRLEDGIWQQLFAVAES